MAIACLKHSAIASIVGLYLDRPLGAEQWEMGET